MFEKIRYHAANIRRHWRLFAMLLGFIALSAWLFDKNYAFQSPIVERTGNVNAALMSLTEETPDDVWNSRAQCLTDLRNIRDNLNQDLFTE
jgi:hypothetical protein